MTEEKKYQLIKVAKDLGVGITTVAEELTKSGFDVEAKPNTKIGEDMYQILLKAFKKDMEVMEESRKMDRERKEEESKNKSVYAAPIKEEPIIDIPTPKVETKKTPSVENIPPVEKKIEEEKPKSEKIIEEKPIVEETKIPQEPEIKEQPEKIEVPEVVPEKEEVKEVLKEEDSSKIKLTQIGKIDLSKFDSKKPEKKGKEKIKQKIEDPALKPKQEEKPISKEKVKEVEVVTEKEVPVEKDEVVEPIVAKTENPVTEAENPEKIDDDASSVKQFTRVELSGPKLMGKIDLGELDRLKKMDKKPEQSHLDDIKNKRKKRKKIVPTTVISTDNPNLKDTINKNRLDVNRGGNTGSPKKYGNKPYTPADAPKQEITDKQVQDKLKQTLARLQPGKGNYNSGNRTKMRKQKRNLHAQRNEEHMLEQEKEKNILKATEFISANELAKMMDVSVNEVITTCFQLGMMVSINQRLDAETISILADEFGFEVQFVGADMQESLDEDVIESDDDLVARPPIVTVMGHVDHGKTSLLDFIRNTNIIAGEAGGITQHVGAYEVTTATGRKITFLDTPGHEAFTAMRARGAQLTDIAIIVISADDAVMPQTREAISHAQAANVPMIFALNKMDKEGANPEKIREQLAGMNILVEDWGGKFQSQEISAKKGMNVDILLEKVLLEADLLDLKGNPNRTAKGVLIEAKLDKGRGVVATLMVQTGTLKIGDAVIAGYHYGKVKAMFNERGQKITEAGPSTPVSILGFSSAPQAGDTFVVMADEDKLKSIVSKREQLNREQGLRTKKHITLDEIGRRLAIGNFKELNIIIKADVDGSAEALTDSFLKLSTPEIQVNVIHKGVGQISESDVLLASASDAIVIGFQVRPSAQARKLAENEDIEIRHYSIIYDAINDVKDAMEGMLAPTIEEKIVCTISVRQVFRITKVGSIAGCMVTEGKVHRNTKLRVVRDGVVVHTGDIDSLKRFKDDVKEVTHGYECGISLKNYNDLVEGDILEGFEQVEIKRKL